MHLIVGGLIRTDSISESEHVSTIPYYYDDLTWCVNQAKQFPVWQNIFYMIQDTEVYVCGAFGITGMVFLAYLWTAFEDKPIDIFRVVLLGTAVFVVFTPSFNPKKGWVRFFYILSVYICIWFQNILAAYFVVALTRPIHDEQVRSVNELIANGFRLMGDSHLLSRIKHQDKVFR